MVTNIVIAIVVSIVSGLAAAMFNQYMNRKRTKAEIEKLDLETQKLRADLDYMLCSATEVIIYDSSKSLPGYDFKGYGGQAYANGAHFGIKGAAELNFLGENREIMSIRRTNNDGKYHVALRTYRNGGNGNSQTLNANAAIPGVRKLRVSCEVKVTGSQHILWFGWRLVPDKTWLDRARVAVESKTWIPIDRYFEVDPGKEIFLRMDDYYETGTTPGEVQIRRIVVAERKTYD